MRQLNIEKSYIKEVLNTRQSRGKGG